MAKIDSKTLSKGSVFLLIFLIVFIRQLKKIPAKRLAIAAKISTNNHPETCKRQSIKMFKDAILWYIFRVNNY